MYLRETWTCNSWNCSLLGKERNQQRCAFYLCGKSQKTHRKTLPLPSQLQVSVPRIQNAPCSRSSGAGVPEAQGFPALVDLPGLPGCPCPALARTLWMDPPALPPSPSFLLPYPSPSSLSFLSFPSSSPSSTLSLLPSFIPPSPSPFFFVFSSTHQLLSLRLFFLDGSSCPLKRLRELSLHTSSLSTLTLSLCHPSLAQTCNNTLGPWRGLQPGPRT